MPDSKPEVRKRALLWLCGTFLLPVGGAIAKAILGYVQNESFISSLQNGFVAFAVIVVAIDCSFRIWEYLLGQFLPQSSMEFSEIDIHQLGKQNANSSFVVRNPSLFRLRKTEARVTKFELLKPYYDPQSTRIQASSFKTTPLLPNEENIGSPASVDIPRLGGAREFFFVCRRTGENEQPDQIGFRQKPFNFFVQSCMAIVRVTISADNAFPQDFHFFVDAPPGQPLTIELCRDRDEAYSKAVGAGVLWNQEYGVLANS